MAHFPARFHTPPPLGDLLKGNEHLTKILYGRSWTYSLSVFLAAVWARCRLEASVFQAWMVDDPHPRSGQHHRPCLPLSHPVN